MLILNLAELGDILTTPPICPPYSLRIHHNIPIQIPRQKTMHYYTAINQHTSTLQHDAYAHTYHKLIKNGTEESVIFQPVLQAHPT